MSVMHHALFGIFNHIVKKLPVISSHNIPTALSIAAKSNPVMDMVCSAPGH